VHNRVILSRKVGRPRELRTVAEAVRCGARTGFVEVGF